jgi:hypothetical protein
MYSSTILDPDTIWKRDVSFTPSPGYFTPEETGPVSIREEAGWAPRAGLDAVEKIKISCPCQELNPKCVASILSLY